MTTISATIIADSIGEHAPRLTTMQLRYPRAIHAELMTHRVFSRNASSSRAIPVERLIKDVIDDPFVPLHWGKNQKGMQANEECDENVWLNSAPPLRSRFAIDREGAWLRARSYAVEVARAFSNSGYHKQIVNRLLEPFAHINVIVSSTQWSNFFALRDHPDAEPHIQLLAKEMRKAMDKSMPQRLYEGEWHLPYVEPWDRERSLMAPKRDPEELVKVSVARCARVSYMTHDGRVPDFVEDLALAERLLGSVPLHASPAEHQAYINYGSLRDDVYDHKKLLKLCGNFGDGWTQYRKTLDGECQ